MKKIAILLLCLFVTGCTAVRIDTESVDNIINVILTKENDLYNRIGKGYKYYIPKGVTYIDTNELNDKLYSNGIYYYLYIDTVGYFYNAATNYTEDGGAYYSKNISFLYNGYLDIIKKEDEYYITFFYNYSKIEAVVEEEDIPEVILNASYILSTVKFNDNIIELSLNKGYLDNTEEVYSKFEGTTQDESVLQAYEESEN